MPAAGGEGFHFLTATTSQATSPAVTTLRQQRQVQFQWRQLSCPLAPVCLVEALRGQLVLQGKQMQVRRAEGARVSSITTHWAARVCSPEQRGPGMPQPRPFLPQDACEGRRCQQPPGTVAWGEAANKDVTQLSNFTGSCSYLKPKPWEVSAYTTDISDSSIISKWTVFTAPSAGGAHAVPQADETWAACHTHSKLWRLPLVGHIKGV